MNFTALLHGFALLWWYLIVVGAVVLVHEAGHYIVARIFGVRVQVFSFGFGPRLFGFRRGDTDFRCSAIPLGGYVSMADGPPTDLSALAAKPRWQRILIALAGPLINIALSIGIVAGLFMAHFPQAEKAIDPVIGWVDPSGPANRAGVHEGDRVVGIESIVHPTWEDIHMNEIAGAGRSENVLLWRDGRRVRVVVTPEYDERQGIGYAGWGLRTQVRLSAVSPDMPAAHAGLQAGDVLTSINGVRIMSLQSVRQVLEAAENKPLQIVYSRNGHESTTVVAAFRNHAIFYPTASWIIGVALEPAHSYVKLTLPSAIAESAHRNMQMGGLILHFFASLVERRMSSKVISGPIQIAVVSNAAAQEGIAALLELIATISLNLAIINLLPMPILDGGMVLRLLIEAALGRDLDFAVRAAVARVGAALLLVLAVFVIYNDLSKLLLGG